MRDPRAGADLRALWYLDCRSWIREGGHFLLLRALRRRRRRARSARPNVINLRAASAPRWRFYLLGEGKMAIGPRRKDRRDNCPDEGADEPPGLIDKEATDIETESWCCTGDLERLFETQRCRRRMAASLAIPIMQSCSVKRLRGLTAARTSALCAPSPWKARPQENFAADKMCFCVSSAKAGTLHQAAGAIGSGLTSSSRSGSPQRASIICRTWSRSRTMD